MLACFFLMVFLDRVCIYQEGRFHTKSFNPRGRNSSGVFSVLQASQCSERHYTVAGLSEKHGTIAGRTGQSG